MKPITIYPAKTIYTMDPSAPAVEAIAVREDRIVARGSVAELMDYPQAAIDERFGDSILLPGFVEAHSHAGSGNVWRDLYVGQLDRFDPHGAAWPGCKTVDDVVARLQEAEKHLEDADQPLLAWGLDPIQFESSSVTRWDLDRVSESRPIHLIHANGHECTVNSAALQRCEVDKDSPVPGVQRDSAGELTGVFREFAAMALVSSVTNADSGLLNINDLALRSFSQEAVNTGTTTVTDLGTLRLMEDEGVELYTSTVTSDFPVRLNVFHFGAGVGEQTSSLAEAAGRIAQVAERSTSTLRFGNIKLMLDGSIQGFTARLMEPGYFTTPDNGIWNISPEEYFQAFETFHRAGLLIHVHCNGDQATQLFLDTLEQILTRYPRPDHRHTCTHSQMTTAAQYRRMSRLGACANIFANHIWAWGDQHADLTVGLDRAKQMNAARTALRSGVEISLHSDTPVTPLGPLATVKHAVTRLTMSGRTLGENECLDREQALRAVTLGGAYLLKMDDEVGSLEPGKFADMAVLDEDPYACPAERIGDIRVLGTMLGGRFHPSTRVIDDAAT